MLVDVDLPEVDGYGIVTHLKKSKKLGGVPVLLLAGAFEPVDQERARAVGCDGVIVKPFEPQHLVTRVKELLAAAGGVGRSVGAARSDWQGAGLHRARRFPFAGDLARRRGSPVGARDENAETRSVDVTCRGRGPERLRPVRAARTDGGAGPGAARIADASRLGHGRAWSVASRLRCHRRYLWPLPLPTVATQAAPAKVSLASAFSALLAAEQSSQPTPAAPSQVRCSPTRRSRTPSAACSCG